MKELECLLTADVREELVEIASKQWRLGDKDFEKISDMIRRKTMDRTRNFEDTSSIALERTGQKLEFERLRLSVTQGSLMLDSFCLKETDRFSVGVVGSSSLADTRFNKAKDEEDLKVK